jgi:hypothetical protein
MMDDGLRAFIWFGYSVVVALALGSVALIAGLFLT